MAEQNKAEHNKTGFLDRTISQFRIAWRSIAGVSFDAEAASLAPHLPDVDADRLREQMRACLETRGGEVSARARAAALGEAYLALNDIGRGRFLKIMADDFDVDGEAVDGAMEVLKQTGNRESRHTAEQGLRRALEAPRVRLLTQFNALPEGIKFLVDMRAELRLIAQENKEENEEGDPGLRALEQDLKGLLGTWFDVDFLELRRISWDSGSASLLEKLIAYEAVHAIESWDDLKNRLQSDRRCFAFFHPRMPDEPLIFVEVALVNGMAGNVQALLDEDAPIIDPGSADTAVFYSISNAQKGLAGISFGGFLIKRVVDRLAGEFKNLKTFATLSPVPGFGTWLERVCNEPDLLTHAEAKAIGAEGRDDAGKVLESILETPGWHADPALAGTLEDPLTRLCARYLVEVKRVKGDNAEPVTAADPVAHFHLRNGARLERINWLGDTSARGLEQSCGIMVNYLYNQDQIENNHEAYTSAGTVVASSAIRNFLPG